MPFSSTALKAPEAPSGPAVDARSIDELDAAICTLSRRLHAETYRLLVLVREFDDRFGFAKWSFKSCAEWLAWRSQISLSAAREKVRTAQALRNLPATSEAFAEGRLSYSKVRALTRVATARDEDLLLAYALNATAAQFEERCRQMRNVQPQATNSARHVWEHRSLTIARNVERGTVVITVELPTEDGELVSRALDRAVASRDVAEGKDHIAAHGEERSKTDSWRAQQADALIAMARAYLTRGNTSTVSPSSSTATDASESSTSTADHYQLVVHVDESVLRRGALRGGIGRSDLPLETVRRLSCDGNLIALIDDARGRPLALGRKRRVVSPALKKALLSRDRGCTFPGCHRKHYVDAHHLEHWSNGGKTELQNLTLLCSYHHHLLHEGGFSIRRANDGALEYRRADGRSIPRTGYRFDDMHDDERYSENEPCAENELSGDAEPSAEGFCTGMVRERAAVYVLKPDSPRRRASGTVGRRAG